MNMKKNLKRIMAYLTVFVMVFSLVNISMEKEVKADNGFEITLSKMNPEKPNVGDEFYFENATISVGSEYEGKLVTGLIISVNKGSISTFPTVDSSVGGYMTDNLTAHQTITCYWNAGKTIDEITEILKSIKYKFAEDMKITVTVDTNETNLPTGDNKITTYILSNPISSRESGDSVHYYMFVPNTSSKKYKWSEAYNEAKGYYFMGMRGYLATITEKDEDAVLDKITDVGAWAGGARVTDTDNDNNHIGIAFDSDTSDAYGVPACDKNSAKSSWYWVCGPEAGFYINTSGTSGKYGTGTDSSSTDSYKNKDNQYVQQHKGGTYGQESETPMYSNWRRDGGTDQEPNDYTASSGDNKNGEYRLQVHYPSCKKSEQGLTFTTSSGKTAVSGWNDLPDGGNSSGNVQGFFVEFSKYTKPDGSSSGNYNTNPSVTVTLDVSHEHQWVTKVESSNPSENPELQNTLVIECQECGEQHKLSVYTNDMEYSDTPYGPLDLQDSISSFDDSYSTEVIYIGVDGTEYESAEPPKNAGNYKVVVKLKKNDETVYFEDGSEAIAQKTFNIRPKEASVTAAPQTIKIGDEISSTINDVVAAGLCDGHALSEITVTKDETNNLVKPSDAVFINASGEDVTGNYNITYVDGLLTQNKRDISVATKPTATGITYGDSLAASSLSGGTVKDGDTIVEGHWGWVADDSQQPESVRPSVGDSGVRGFRAIFYPDNTEWYDPIVTDGITLTVDKKKINIEWDYTEGDFTYNGQEQKPEAAVVRPTGFPEELSLPDVKVSVIDASTTLRDGIDATPEGVSYTAKAEITGDNAANYEIENPGNTEITYKIGKAQLSVELKDQEIKKKETIKSGTDQIKSSNGLMSGDTVTEFTVKDDRTDAQNPKVTGDSIVIKNGSYDVTENYDVTYVPGTLIEHKIILDVDNVAEEPSVTEITYGDTVGESEISGGVVKYGEEIIEGDWKWDDSEIIPDAGDDGKFVIKFTPKDEETYTPLTFEIKVKVKPKKISLEWGPNEFTYNGKEQAPKAEFASGEILQRDAEDVTIEVSGQKTDVNALADNDEEKDHYVATATLSGEKAGNYEIIEDYRTKDFIIVPLELDNTNAEILIGQDVNGNPTVSAVSIIKDDSMGELSGKKLELSSPGTEDGDYTYTTKTEEKSPFINIIAKFSGNYKGKATRTITKPKKTEVKKGDKIVGEMEIFVMVDDSVDESLNPGIKRCDESEEAVLDDFLENFNDVTLVGGASLKDKLEDPNNKDYVIFSDKYINLNETSEGALESGEIGLVGDAKAALANESGKEVYVPLYLDLTMRQEYEIKTSEGEPVAGVVSGTGEVVSQVRMSEPIYTNDGEAVEISFDFPSELIKKGYKTFVSVLRIHNIVENEQQTGNYESDYVVDKQEVNVNSRRITFTTQKFSTYVVMYTEEKIPTGGGKTPDKNTPLWLPGNDIPIFSEEVTSVSEVMSAAPAVVNAIEVLPITPYSEPVEYVSPKTKDTNEVYIFAAIMAAGAGIVLKELIKKKRKKI